jgi:hypothetical protein
MKNSRAYSVLNQISVLFIVVGAFTVLAGIAPVTTGNNIRELELAGGTGAVVLGLVFLVLSDLGARLFRIEAKLGTLPKDDFAEVKPDSQVESERR